MIDVDWLLVIDYPDERISGGRGRYDHLHAWGTFPQLSVLKRLIEDTLGGREHELTDSSTCPRCGARKAANET